MRKINKIIEYAKKNKKGFTVYYENGRLTSVKGVEKKRYVVTHKTSIVYSPKEKNIRLFSPIKDKSYLVGRYDKKSGKYLIKSANVVRDKDKAIKLGYSRKQKTVFDLVESKEIPVRRLTTYRPKKDDIVKMKKGGYFNTLTGNYVCESSALRLNRYFKANQKGTLYQAYGGSVYKERDKKGKKISFNNQPKGVFDIWKKGNQLVKTRDKKGDVVFFAPLLNKQIRKDIAKKVMNYDYHEGVFKVSLYRSGVNRKYVYHLASMDIGMLLRETDDLKYMDMMLKARWYKEARRIIFEISRKFPLGKNQRVKIVFNHEIYRQTTNDTGVVTMMSGFFIPRHMGYMESEFREAMQTYNSLMSQYKAIYVINVIIYIYNEQNEKTKMLSEQRLGVMRLRF